MSLLQSIDPAYVFLGPLCGTTIHSTTERKRVVRGTVIEDRPSSSPTIGAKANTVMVSRIDADAVPQIDGIACVIRIKDEPCRRPVAARIACHEEKYGNQDTDGSRICCSHCPAGRAAFRQIDPLGGTIILRIKGE